MAWPEGVPVSLPVRGAWIEIKSRLLVFRMLVSLPVRGAWIEIQGVRLSVRPCESLPVRGAWIEIMTYFLPIMLLIVAPRAGSVD